MCNCINSSNDGTIENNTGQTHRTSSLSGHESNNRKRPNFNFTNWPKVENGILAFTDGDHLNTYIQYLEDMVIVPSYSNASQANQDSADILQTIENKLGFTSLRNTTEAAFAKLNEVGWDTIEEIPFKHFIHSDVIKSTLNPNADIKVGDTITHYVNKDFAVTISATDLNTLNRLHSFGINARIENLEQLRNQTNGEFYIGRSDIVSVVISDTETTNTHFNGKILNSNSDVQGRGDALSGNVMSNFSYVGVLDSPSDIDDVRRGGSKWRSSDDHHIAAKTTASCKLEVETPPYIDVVGTCDPAVIRTVGMAGIKLLTTSGTLINNWHCKIDWGGAGHGHTEFDVFDVRAADYTYKSAGIYNINLYAYDSITATTPCDTKTFSISIPINCHYGKSSGGVEWKYRADGYRAMRCYSSVDFKWAGKVGLFFPCTRGLPYRRTEASTEAFHWEKDFWGKWKWREYNKAVRLVVEFSIDWNMEKIGKGCERVATDTAASWPWGAKKAEVQLSECRLYGWENLFSRHEMWTGDGWPPITHTMLRHPC